MRAARRSSKTGWESRREDELALLDGEGLAPPCRRLLGLKGGICRLASIEAGRLRVPTGGGEGYRFAASSRLRVADAVDSRLLRRRSSVGDAEPSVEKEGEEGEGEKG